MDPLNIVVGVPDRLIMSYMVTEYDPPAIMVLVIESKRPIISLIVMDPLNTVDTEPKNGNNSYMMIEPAYLVVITPAIETISKMVNARFITVLVESDNGKSSYTVIDSCEPPVL